MATVGQTGFPSPKNEIKMLTIPAAASVNPLASTVLKFIRQMAMIATAKYVLYDMIILDESSSDDDELMMLNCERPCFYIKSHDKHFHFKQQNVIIADNNNATF